MNSNKKDYLLTVPNFLSSLRILLVPVFILMITHHKTITAFVVFLIAASTDLLDGITARAMNQKSKLGSYLDPAGDKLLMICSFIILSFPEFSSPNVIPLWLTIIVVARDVFIAIIAFFLYKFRGKNAFMPSSLGKTCTFSQMGVVMIVLFFNSIQTSPFFLFGLYIFVLILTILSGLHYFIIGFRTDQPQKDN